MAQCRPPAHAHTQADLPACPVGRGGNGDPEETPGWKNFSAPVEAIKFRMEQLGYTQSDLANVVGLKSRASEILYRKRKLSLEIIRQLNNRLNIPAEIVIQTY